MDNVVSEQQGDSETGFVYGYLLQFAVIRGGICIEQIAAAAFADVLFESGTHGRTGYAPVGGEHRKLAYLFVHGHLLHKPVHPGLGAGGGEYRGGYQE